MQGISVAGMLSQEKLPEPANSLPLWNVPAAFHIFLFTV